MLLSVPNRLLVKKTMLKNDFNEIRMPVTESQCLTVMRLPLWFVTVAVITAWDRFDDATKIHS